MIDEEYTTCPECGTQGDIEGPLDAYDLDAGTIVHCPECGEEWLA